MGIATTSGVVTSVTKETSPVSENISIGDNNYTIVRYLQDRTTTVTKYDGISYDEAMTLLSEAGNFREEFSGSHKYGAVTYDVVIKDAQGQNITVEVAQLENSNLWTATKTVVDCYTYAKT